MIKPSYERIKFLQNQLRTAIQNHHVLLLKSRLAPQDTEIKNQMNILQSLIISMGRTQNELLDQLERELENNVVARAEVGRHLSWNIPKNVPIFKSNCIKSELNKSDDNISVILAKTSVPSKPPPRVYSRMHSLLKPIKPKDASDGIKADELSSVWKNPKKLQSVLKSKTNNENVKGFIRIHADNTKICGALICEEVVSNEDSVTSPKRRKTTDSEPNSRSNSVSPKPLTTPKQEHTRRKVVETKLLTRSKKRRAVEAAAAAAKAASFSGNSEKDINDLEESLKNEPIDPTIPVDEKILKNLDTYEEMGKIKFLESFCLISMSEREALRAKKGGRKRRTAAGQSNFYNDYFQHSALSMKNPKWRYEMQPVRRAPRDTSKKASLLEGTRRGTSSPPETITSGEVTPEEKASPPRDSPPKNVSEASTETSGLNDALSAHKSKDKAEEDSFMGVGSTSRNSIVEAPELEEDEEKDKEKLCILCRAPGEEGTLEICTVCGEKYHTACATSESEGRCTLCLAQISGFKAIVGGEAGVSSSSSLEVIKRYLPT